MVLPLTRHFVLIITVMSTLAIQTVTEDIVKTFSQFVYNKPQEIVKDCLQKMTLAASIDTSGITYTGE